MQSLTTSASPSYISSYQAPLPSTRKSVKHLTCHFWGKYGHCKYQANGCLYAHHHTGQMAPGPRPTEKGQPAIDGNNAQNTNPIYMDWRNTERLNQTEYFPHPHLPVMPPRIRNQIGHIHQKAYVPISTAQHPFAAPHSTFDTTPHKLDDSNNFHDDKDSTEHEIESLLHVVRLLSTALSAYQDSARNTSETLYTECVTLLEIGRTLHGNREKVPVYVETFTHSLKSILDVARSNTANTASIALVLKTVTEELDKVGLGHAMVVDAEFMLDAGGKLVERKDLLV